MEGSFILSTTKTGSGRLNSNVPNPSSGQGEDVNYEFTLWMKKIKINE